LDLVEESPAQKNGVKKEAEKRSEETEEKAEVM